MKIESEGGEKTSGVTYFVLKTICQLLPLVFYTRQCKSGYFFFIEQKKICLDMTDCTDENQKDKITPGQKISYPSFCAI